MLIYLDAGCFNRPFDDQSQSRIQSETDAILAILQRVESQSDELAWSSALTVELVAHPEAEIREQLMSWADRSHVTLATDSAVRKRTGELTAQGLHALDAAHVAFAEAANCDTLITCDDRFLRRAQRLGLSLRILNPLEYVEEVTRDSANE